VSGPGFLNITIADRAVLENLAARYADETVHGNVRARPFAWSGGGASGGSLRANRRRPPSCPS
ncbi:hypothetical protein ACWDUG_31285, partial [Streptomyces cellulosae]